MQLYQRLCVGARTFPFLCVIAFLLLGGAAHFLAMRSNKIGSRQPQRLKLERGENFIGKRVGTGALVAMSTQASLLAGSGSLQSSSTSSASLSVSSMISSTVTQALTTEQVTTSTEAVSRTTSSDASLSMLSTTSVVASTSVSISLTDVASLAALEFATTTVAVSNAFSTAMSSAQVSISAADSTTAAQTASATTEAAVTTAALTTSSDGITSAILGSPSPQPGSIVISGETIVDGNWNSPPVIIYDGNDAVVKVKGKAFLSGTAVIVIALDTNFDDTTRRVLVAAAQVSGEFAKVNTQGQSRSMDGKCYGYFVANQDSSDHSLSVLLVPREEQCKTKSNRVWIVTGITAGVGGVIVILLGGLWLGRDVFQRWARGRPDESEENMIA